MYNYFVCLSLDSHTSQDNYMYVYTYIVRSGIVSADVCTCSCHKLCRQLMRATILGNVEQHLANEKSLVYGGF